MKQANPEQRPVRCPSDACGAVFAVAIESLGRSTTCPECGSRLTARPVSIDARLRLQEQRLVGAGGARVARLPFAVVVDNVRSLWNVGSIFRTADAFSVRRLVLCGITGCPPRPEISKTALGAEQAVAWSFRADPLEAVRELESDDFVPVALESSAGSVPLAEMRWPSRTCLVIGNEVAGVSETVLRIVERHVSIPMHGVKDSLNVAVAFGIAAQSVAEGLRRSSPTRV